MTDRHLSSCCYQQAKRKRKRRPADGSTSEEEEEEQEQEEEEDPDGVWAAVLTLARRWRGHFGEKEEEESWTRDGSKVETP